MDAPLLVLIHSPLVGPLTWRACADTLEAMGHRTVVPTLAGVTEEDPPWIPKLARRAAAAIGGTAAPDGAALIVHSGAGTLVVRQR